MSKNEEIQLRILEEYNHGKISRSEAAQVLGLSEKIVQRKAKSIRSLGLLGVKHCNCGRCAVNKVGKELEAQVIELRSRCLNSIQKKKFKQSQKVRLIKGGIRF